MIISDHLSNRESSTSRASSLVETHPPTLAGVPLHLLAQDVDLLVGLVQLQLGLLLSNLILAGRALSDMK